MFALNNTIIPITLKMISFLNFKLGTTWEKTPFIYAGVGWSMEYD